MNEEIRDKIYEFLKSLSTEIDVLYHVDIDEIDLEDPYESIYNMIDDDGGFDVDIIYYQNAIEYLMKNDNSLYDSLAVAYEYGYTCNNLNSEILASLLASRKSRENFYNLQNEIDDFFEEIKSELDNIEEDEEI